MESTHTIFVATLNEHKKNPQFLSILHDIVFELSKKKINRLKDEKNIQSRLSELFEVFTKDLESEGLKTVKTLSCVIDGIIKAATYEKEEFLYKTIYEKDQLEKSIITQKKEIRESIQATFDTIETHIQKFDEATLKETSHALNDAKLRGIEMLGILKETTSEALLTTLEKAHDIEDTVFEITKNITYQAINEGEFTKQRFLDISSSIIEAAIEIADEDQTFAKNLLSGAIHGTKEGMAKAIDKYKNDLKFAPEEIIENDLKNAKKELIKVDEAYVRMIEETAAHSSGASIKIIDEILSNKINSSFAKVKRVANEASEAISEKIEEIKINALSKDYDFVEKAEAKIALLRKEMGKIEVRAGNKFESLKREMGELEKSVSKKVEAIKSFEFENEKAKKAATEAKRLGNRAWEVAKGALDGAMKGVKDAMKKDE